MTVSGWRRTPTTCRSEVAMKVKTRQKDMPVPVKVVFSEENLVEGKDLWIKPGEPYWLLMTGKSGLFDLLTDAQLKDRYEVSEDS